MEKGPDAADVLAKIELMELVSEYVDLKKSGVEYVGLCPAHSERTPSFYVNPVKQLFLCRGCSFGGDAFTFVQKMLGLNFKDAVAYLSGAPIAHVEPIKRDTKRAEQLERERKYLAERAEKEAAVIIKTCSTKTHGYLMRKSSGMASVLALTRGFVTPEDVLIIPMHSFLDYNRILAVQRIWWDNVEEDPDKEKKMGWVKKYNFGATSMGVIHYIGHRDFPETIFCEGYATGLSIKCALGPMRINVGVCFSAANMLKISEMTKGPGRYVFADNDKSGTGQLYAERTGLPWLMPPTIGQDANDFHQERGAIALRGLILKLRKQ